MKTNYTFQNSWSKMTQQFFGIFLLCFLFAEVNLQAQTTVFSDDFNRSTYTTPQVGGTPSATYTTGSGSNGSISMRVWTAPDYALQISGLGTAGNSFTYFDNTIFTHPYSSGSGLKASSGLITWYFNFRNYGNSINYKTAIVLASSGSDFNTSNGYAVYYNKNTTLKFSLAKFTGGVLGTATDVIPELATNNLPSATNQNYSSVMVTFDPATDNWSLYVRDDGSVLTLPWTGTLTQHGSTVSDNTYTSSADNLKFSGFYYKYSTGTSANYKANFDNFKVTQVASTAPTVQSSNLVFNPVALNTLTASWTNGNGGKRIVKMNTSNSFSNPVNGVDPTANPVYSGAGEQVVYNGTGNTVNISGLTLNTQYWFRVYDYSYGALFSPFFKTETASNNPSSVTTLAEIVAPTVTSSTASSILNNGATLGGNITSDGGSAIIERGTVWNTTAGVTISNNKLAEGAVLTGIFTQARTLLPSKTLIYYAAYATNAVGSSLSPESSFYTKADEPTSNVGSFVANPVAESTTELNLSWTPAIGADGYLIVQKAGASAAGTAPSDGNGYSVGAILGTGTIAAVVASGAATSQVISGLNAGSQYTFRIYPFGYDGTNAQTYNYYTITPYTDVSGTTSTTTEFLNITSNIKLHVLEGDVLIYSAKNQNILISSLTGQLVVNKLIKTDNEKINLKNGLYIIRVGDKRFKIQVNE